MRKEFRARLDFRDRLRCSTDKVGEMVIKITSTYQDCQMVSFQTKNPKLGKFWRALAWKMLIYFMAIWNMLQKFGSFYDHFVHFVFIWYIFPVLISCTKKNLATLVLARFSL
jgi:hypothetical protein